MSRSAKISHVFTNIPMKTEKATSPCRYSFFIGLKYVLRKSGNENSCKNERLSEKKNFKRAKGLSKNQNLRNITGRTK